MGSFGSGNHRFSFGIYFIFGCYLCVWAKDEILISDDTSGFHCDAYEDIKVDGT